MGGSSGSGQQTSTNKVELPPWLDQAAQDYVSTTSSVANRPYDAYTGQQIAGFSADQSNAFQGVRDLQGATGSALTGLAGQAAGYANYQPQQVQAGSLPQTDLSGYMNPYISTVVQNAMQGLDQQRMGAQNQLATQAQAGNAYGGSRYALQAASTDAQAAQAAGTMQAQLYGQGFQNAQQMAMQDLNRGLTAQQSNQQAGLTAANLGLQGLNYAGQMVGNAQNANYKDLAALEGVGTAQQSMNQQYMDLAQQQWQDARNYPLEQLQILQSGLTGTPYGGTTSATTTGGSKGNANAAIAGGAMSGAAAGVPLAGATYGLSIPIGAIIGAGAGYAGSR